MGKIRLTIRINGTDENPFHKFGLKMNPFPQIPGAEFMPAMYQLNKLAAQPIKNREQIREILQGWSEEFVELCCRKFEPGKMVEFVVEFSHHKDRELT